MMKFVNKMVKKDSVLLKCVLKIYNLLPFNNKIKLHGNKLQVGSSMLRGCKIVACGVGNTIIINNWCRLSGCSFIIHGSNNTIVLSDYISANNVEFYMEDSGNCISVGEHTSLCGKAHLACIEGCTISIGKDCLFSSDITFRTGDSHSIMNMDGVRVNPSKDISIGNHTWIGYKVSINKGAKIAANSIVGTGAIVTKVFDQQNVIIAGIPAKIIKENVNWDNARIPVAGDEK